MSRDTGLVFAYRKALMNYVTDKHFYYFYTDRIFHLNNLYKIKNEWYITIITNYSVNKKFLILNVDVI